MKIKVSVNVEMSVHEADKLIIALEYYAEDTGEKECYDLADKIRNAINGEEE
jgi:hypothetical protein